MPEPSLGSSRRRLSRKRLFGLDRSGGPPPQSQAGEPLRPWTIPNAIGYLRALMIPLFVVASFVWGSPAGINWVAAVACCIAGVGDYVDGFAARLTGQYSRLGTLLDPILDRLLVIAGVVVCWHFELLPRWALALLLARELLMLILGRIWLGRGLDLRINWPGRIAVAPTMFGLLMGLLGVRGVGEGFLYAGILLALLATALYVQSGIAQLRSLPAAAAGPGAGGDGAGPRADQAVGPAESSSPEEPLP